MDKNTESIIDVVTVDEKKNKTKKTIATIIQYILGWLNIPVPVK